MRGRDRPPAGCDRLANRAAQASGSRRRPAMAWSSSNTRHDDRHGGLAKDSFAVMAAVHAGPDSRWTRYPARAPRERAILRHASRFGVEARQMQTRRRTELTTWTLSLSSRSRSHITWVRAHGGARRVQPQFLHEHVGCGGQKNAQLVRPESAAARAVELQVLEFLDPVLDVATGAVDLLVEKTRRLPQVRHHETRVVPRLAVPETDDFGLDDDPARVAPRPAA